MKKPHIIIFNPDEMRADAMAHLGNPAAVTPHLDRFAAQDAVSFSNAFCQNPVCVPSRCSFFTGLYPHVNGHRTMSYLLHPGEGNLFSELRESGYYVWMNDRNDLFAGQIDGWAESNADEIYYSAAVPGAPGPVDPALRGQPGGKNYYSHFHGELGVDAEGRNRSTDDYVVDAAIERILHPADDRPMCLFLGLMFPHVPYSVEQPYYSAVDRKKLPARIRPEDCRGKAKILDSIRSKLNMQDYTEAEWDELRAVYLGMCAKVDAQFGRLMQALKDAGIYDDCAIFFLSDHGDFCGDYGLVEKAQNSFEDCLTKVPFLVKPPKGVGCTPGVSDSLVELVDFYATAIDFAGAAPSHTHFGRSVRPLLAEHTAQLRPFVCCEGGRTADEVHCDEYHCYGPDGASPRMEYWPKIMAQADPDAHAKGIMLRTKEYKYISRVAGQDELYDLRQDSGETDNRIDDPAYTAVLTELRLQMLKWLESTSDIVPFRYDERWTQKMTYYRLKHALPPENLEAGLALQQKGENFLTILAKLGRK